jgi:hypothetical protein
MFGNERADVTKGVVGSTERIYIDSMFLHEAPHPFIDGTLGTTTGEVMIQSYVHRAVLTKLDEFKRRPIRNVLTIHAVPQSHEEFHQPWI